jgi:hypothetical protein
MSNPFLIIGSFVLALFGITILPKTAEAPVVKDPNGGSRGLLQINGFWNNWLIERDLIDKPSDLLHADANLRAGLEIYNYGVNRYGFGWGPWSATK